MPTCQWVDIPFGLETPAGNIGFNAFLSVTNPVTLLANQTGPQWQLDVDKCGAGASKRVTRDNIPQKDGEIIHRYFRGGLVMQLGALAVDVTQAATDAEGVGNTVFEPACLNDLVVLFDDLQRKLNSVSNANARLSWVPSGKPVRMQDKARWIGPDAGGGGGFQAVQVAIDDNVFTSVQFALLCPFPYGMDATEISTELSGTPVTVDNVGTCPFFPVIKVFGPATSFTIIVENAVTGQIFNLIYDSSLPGAHAIGGGGDYIEFDFFRETAYLNGDGASRKSGVDIFNSDFWSLTAGLNDVSIVGDQASATMLWQAAWSG